MRMRGRLRFYLSPLKDSIFAVASVSCDVCAHLAPHLASEGNHQERGSSVGDHQEFSRAVELTMVDCFDQREDPMAKVNVMAVTLVALVAGVGCQGKPSGDGSTSREAKLMSIENMTWQLVEVGGKPAEVVPADAQAAHFRLSSEEKRATGYSGVNQFNGAYELSGQALRFKPLAMTRRAGPAPLMQQESAFGEALENAESWRAVDDKNIELLDAKGTALAKFVAKTS